MKNELIDLAGLPNNTMNTDNLNTDASRGSKAGRPSKYTNQTIQRILKALADGLTIKEACIASGISEQTLIAWRKKYPELEARLAEARQAVHQKALAGILTAGEKDWRALEAFLRLSFQEKYRRDFQANTSVEVNTTVQQAVVVDEARRKQLVAQHRKLFGGEDEKSALEKTPRKEIEDAPVAIAVVGEKSTPELATTEQGPAAEHQVDALEAQRQVWHELIARQAAAEANQEEEPDEGAEPWSR
jgi:Transposase